MTITERLKLFVEQVSGHDELKDQIFNIVVDEFSHEVRDNSSSHGAEIMAAYKSGTDDLYVFTEVNENGGETEYFDVCLDGSCEDTDEISYKSTDLILFTTMLISFSAGRKRFRLSANGGKDAVFIPIREFMNSSFTRDAKNNDILSIADFRQSPVLAEIEPLLGAVANTPGLPDVAVFGVAVKLGEIVMEDGEVLVPVSPSGNGTPAEFAFGSDPDHTDGRRHLLMFTNLISAYSFSDRLIIRKMKFAELLGCLLENDALDSIVVCTEDLSGSMFKINRDMATLAI